MLIRMYLENEEIQVLGKMHKDHETGKYRFDELGESQFCYETVYFNEDNRPYVENNLSWFQENGMLKDIVEIQDMISNQKIEFILYVGNSCLNISKNELIGEN